MKSIKYSRYTGEDFGIDAQDLLQALSDFFLQSGFNSNYSQFMEMDQRTMEDLKQAIQRALESGDLFPDDQMQQMMEKLQSMSPDQINQLLESLVQKLADEGHVSISHPDKPIEQPQGGSGAAPDASIKFEVTDKSLDLPAHPSNMSSATR